MPTITPIPCDSRPRMAAAAALALAIAAGPVHDVAAAGFAELVGVTAPTLRPCQLAGKSFSVCPEFKPFPRELARYDVPAADLMRLPEMSAFHRSVVQALPKAQWLKKPEGPGKSRFLAAGEANYVTAMICRADRCDTRELVWAMDTAYRGQSGVFVHRDAQTGKEAYRWLGNPDDKTKAVLLAARALHRGEAAIYGR